MAEQIKLNDPEKAKKFFGRKLAFTTGPIEVDYFKKQGDDFVFIDVRDQEDFEKEHACGAINLPRDQWTNTQALRKDKMNILYCYSQTCHLAAAAAFKFAKEGFPVMEMEGGFEAWKENELETESGISSQAKKVA